MKLIERALWCSEVSYPPYLVSVLIYCVNLCFQAPEGDREEAAEGARSPAGRDPDVSLSCEMNRAGPVGAPKSPIHHTSISCFNDLELLFQAEEEVLLGITTKVTPFFFCNEL